MKIRYPDTLCQNSASSKDEQFELNENTFEKASYASTMQLLSPLRFTASNIKYEYSYVRITHICRPPEKREIVGEIVGFPIDEIMQLFHISWTFLSSRHSQMRTKEFLIPWINALAAGELSRKKGAISHRANLILVSSRELHHYVLVFKGVK